MSFAQLFLLRLGYGKIIECKYPLARLVKKNAIEDKDLEITGSEVRMTSYCAACQENEK